MMPVMLAGAGIAELDGTLRTLWGREHRGRPSTFQGYKTKVLSRLVRPEM